MSNIEIPILKDVKIDPDLDKAFTKALKFIQENKNPFGQYPKLVRDNIPNIILANNPTGTSVKYRKLDEETSKDVIKLLCKELLDKNENKITLEKEVKINLDKQDNTSFEENKTPNISNDSFNNYLFSKRNFNNYLKSKREFK